MPEGESGRVVIARKSPRDIKMRDLYLALDDEEERTMLYGDMLELAVDPGEHRIKATNRMFSRKLEFEVGSGETVRLNVANVPSWNPFFFVMLIVGTMPYKVSIERG
jgi:hypothetical protein